MIHRFISWLMNFAMYIHSYVQQMVWAWILVVNPALAQDSDWFETNIRPLLIEKCWECHGPTKQWSSLRLDNQEFLDRGSENGPIIDPRELTASPLLARIESMDPDVRMPPPIRCTH